MKDYILAAFGIVAALILASCTVGQGPATGKTSIPDPIEVLSNTEEIPNNCSSWYDGCNTCFVEDGKIGGCTRKFCPQEIIEKPTCVQYKGEEVLIDDESVDFGNKEVAEIPNNCSSWYDGCNTCFMKDGKIQGCTEMACFRQDSPKCLEFFEE